MASSGWDGIIWIWDFRTGKKLRALRGHKGDVRSLAFSPDGKWLASGSEDKTTKLWNVERGTLLATLPARGRAVEKVAFLGPRGHGQLITVSAKDIQRWNFDDVGQRDELVTLSGHDRPTSVVAFGPRRRLMISSSADGTIRTWDLETMRTVRKFNGHEGNVYAARISPDEKLIASGGRDGTVRLWDVETGAQISQEVTQTVVRDVAFNKDGTLLASAGHDGAIRIWNTKDATLLHRFAGRGAQFAAWRSTPTERSSLRAVTMGKFDSGTQTTGPRFERSRPTTRLSTQSSSALTASFFCRPAKIRRQSCGKFLQGRKCSSSRTRARYGPSISVQTERRSSPEATIRLYNSGALT
jgi:WD40 repeat protein